MGVSLKIIYTEEEDKKRELLEKIAELYFSEVVKKFEGIDFEERVKLLDIIINELKKENHIS